MGTPRREGVLLAVSLGSDRILGDEVQLLTWLHGGVWMLPLLLPALGFHCAFASLCWLVLFPYRTESPREVVKEDKMSHCFVLPPQK